MSKAERLPCPCGSIAQDVWMASDHSGIFLRCRNCGRKTPVVQSAAEADRQWNQMAEKERNT